MRRKFTCFALLALLFVQAKSQSIGDYQSASSGDWTSSVSTRWDVWDGDSWEDALTAPNSSSGVITILSGHSITVGLAPVTADQVAVTSGATLILNNAFTVDDGPGTDLLVDGSLVLNTTLSAGVGTPSVTVNGTLDWLGGTIGLPLAISSTGVLNINSANKFLASVLTNNGTVNWSSSQVTFNNGTLHNNGSFNATGASSFNHAGTSNVFNNNPGASFTKSVNAGNITFNIPVNNSGSIHVNSGSLISTGVNASFTNTGLLNFTGGTGMTIAGSASTNTWDAGTQITGTATITIADELNINTALDLPSTISLIFSAASNVIGGSGSMAINGTTTWNTGTLALPFNINSSGVLNLEVSNVKSLSSTLTNNGIINWNGFNLAFNNGILNNNNIVYAAGNNAFTFTSGNNAFNNSSTGVFKKLTLAGTTTFNIPFNNAGTVDITTGSVTSTSLNATFTNSGAILLSPGTTLTLGGTLAGGNNLNAGTTISGSGDLTLSSNTNINTALVIPAGLSLNYSANSTTLGGSGTLSINGIMNWGAGTLAIPTSVEPGGLLNLVTAGKSLTTSLVNNGTIDWSASTINFNNGSLVNHGNFNITGTATDLTIVSLSTNSFQNTGVITKTSVGATGTGSVPFTNSGTININAGTFSKSGSNVIPFTNSGTINIAAGAVFNHSIGLTSGALILEPGTAINGSGIFRVLANTIINVALNVPATLSTEIGSNINNPSITGTGNVTINGVLDWAQGVMSVPLNIAGGAVMNSTASKTVNTTLTNNGSIFLSDPSTGSIALSNGTFINNGSITDNFVSPRNFPSSGGINSFVNNGSYIKTNNATITFNIGVPVTNNSGALIGGQGSFIFSGGITNSGIIAPGGNTGTGILSITSNAVNPANTPVIHFQINNGTGAGTGHDQLLMSGATTLTGAGIVVTETGIAPAQSYIVMTAPGPNGFIGNFSGVTLPAGYNLVIENTTNPSTVTLTKTVNQTSPPVFSFVPADVTVQCNNIEAPGTPTATGTCAGTITITYNGQTITPGSCTDSYIITRTWTATDNCGNSTNATQTITVIDDTDPVFGFVPANTSVECSSIPPVGSPTASDNCDASVSIVYEGEVITPGVNANSYVITRSWTAYDNCGNSATASQTITVADNTPPQFSFVPANTSVNCSDIPVVGTPLANDNCDTDVEIIYEGQEVVPGSCIGSYTINRKWTAKDNAGNAAEAIQTISVTDNTAPSIACAANQVRNAGVGCSYTASANEFNATASDDCSGVSLSYVLSGATSASGVSLTGVVFNSGVTTVTWTAIDGCGNSSSCSFTVTVHDQTPPVLVCPSNISFNSNCTAQSITVPNPQVTDNCTIATITWQMTGATTSNSASTGINYVGTREFNPGVTTITYYVKDTAGNLSSCSFSVTLSGSSVPTITCPPEITVNALPFLCYAYVSDLGDPVANGGCGGGNLTVSNDHPTNIFPVGVTAVTWTATDANGNTVTCVQNVRVVDTQLPLIYCPSDRTIIADGGECYATNYNLGNPSFVWDNCGVASISNNAPPQLPVGTTIVTWTIRDVNGNTNTCTQEVTVKDGTAPVITCPANINQPATAACTRTIAVPDPAVVDECSSVNRLTWVMTGATVANSPSGGIHYVGTRTFNAGVTTITYTARDIAGNTSTCSFTVTITGTGAPSISCPANISENAQGKNCNKSVKVPNPVIGTGCGSMASLSWVMTGATVGSSPLSGINYVGTRTFNMGTTTITYTVRDAAGNANSCSFNVTVSENQKPQLDCNKSILQWIGNACSKTISIPNISFSDNCGVSSLTWVMSGATTASSPSTGINQVGTRTFNTGLTHVVYTVKDASGNERSCSFTVVLLGSCNYQVRNVEHRSMPHTEINENLQLEAKAYPNPSVAGFNLVISGPNVKEAVQVRVYDAVGRLVHQARVLPGSYRFGDKLVAGTYLVEVVQGKERTQVKVIKK